MLKTNLSRSISTHFDAVHTLNVRYSQKLQKNTEHHYSEGSRSFKVIDVDTRQKLVTSACNFDKQHVRVYLQLFSR